MASKGAVPFRLDEKSGVPVYRQIIDSVLSGIASGAVRPGDQLPTVRQLAVELAVNPNTVMRAYRELEIREIVATQQGTGTFISDKRVEPDEIERRRRLEQLVTDFLSRAAAAGVSLTEILEYLQQLKSDSHRRKTS